MKRSPHILRHNKSGELPQLLAFVDTETHNVSTDPTVEKHVLTFGWVCFERTWGKDKWTEPHWFRFDTPQAFWDIVEGFLRPQTRLYLFAHNWSFDGPVLKIFHLLPAMGWKLTRAIIESPPVILRWNGERRSIMCLDILNWFRFPLAKLGKRVGIEKLPFPSENASTEDWDTYCRRDVEVLRRTVRSWLDFVDTNDLGGFAPTLASQAFRAFRHRFMEHEIFFDDCEPALLLSREAFHGGRTEAFRIGKVEGPIYCYDVNSMYPSVMHSNFYPIRLFTRSKHAKVSDIVKWMDKLCVVARVKIETQEPRFAHFTGEKLVFPTGRFTTTLTTPELKSALERNEIIDCEEVAIYERGDIFTAFVDELYSLRLKFKEQGNDISVWLIKILMNSLYGKFAQRGRVWETVGDADLDDFCTETVIEHPSGKVHQFRRFAGIEQERMEDAEGRESFPAIAAHVTAYARLKLWGLICTAGRKNVLYVDTDSLYVNKDGSVKLEHLVEAKRLGGLKLEKVSPYGEIFGAKDYSFGEDWRCKGVRPSARWLEPNLVEQELWPKLVGLLRRGSLDAPLIMSQQKHLSRIYDKGVVHPDGHVSPLTLCQW